MSSKFHSLKVCDIRKETEDCVSVALEIPNSKERDFQYIPGQYLTFKHFINKEEVRRSYSICSGPNEALRVAIKKVPNGIFSTFANEELKKEDLLEVMEPQGHFYKKIEKDGAHLYVAFAAGSGITPIMSILKSVLSAESDSKFILFYGNRKAESIIFREQLEQLKNSFIGRLEIHHVLSREDTGSDWFTGRIDKKKCKFYFDRIVDPAAVDAFYLCGPYEMTIEVKEELLAQGVAEENIRTELFFIDQKPIAKKQANNAIDFSSSDAKINILLDGQKHTFAMDRDSESILDNAVNRGIDVPYSCKAGVCSTCKAKLEEGKVEMLINYALEPDEVEAGYVLSCQCLPMSGEVSLNFDV